MPFANYMVGQLRTLNGLQPGDLANFNNAAGLMGGWYEMENVIVTGNDSYAGWPVGAHSYMWWLEKLMEEYNSIAQPYPTIAPFITVMPTISIGDVPGYEGQSWFLNIPQLTQKVFEVRTQSQPIP